MSGDYAHQLVEFGELTPTTLSDADALAAVLVAAAGAMGLTPLGPPVVRRGPRGWAASLIGDDGHIVLHTSPDQGRCLINIVARTPAAAERGGEVIARRLGARPSD
jgi:S-adenosylmethionine/arginine decarboxylase-like enzyme